MINLPLLEAVDLQPEELTKISEFIKTEVSVICKSKFDRNVLLAELEQIEPRPSIHDLETAHKEIEDIASGSLREEDSLLLCHILPVLRGETEFDSKAYGEMEDRCHEPGYSHSFIRKLAEGVYKLLQQNSGAAGLGETKSTTLESDINEDKTNINDRESEHPDELIDNNYVMHDNEDLKLFTDVEVDVPPLVPDAVVEQKELEIISDSIKEFNNQSEDNPYEDKLNQHMQNPIVTVDNTIEIKTYSGEEESEGNEEAANHEAQNPLEILYDNGENDDYSVKVESNRNKIPSIRSFKDLFRLLKDWKQQQANEVPVDVLRQHLYEGLKNRDFGMIYCLTRNWGEKAPIPSWLIKLLGLGMNYLPGHMSQLSELDELFYEAAEKIDLLDERGKFLLGAALILPALLAPSKNMLTVVSLLTHHLGRVQLTPFFRDLESFIRRGVAIDKNLLLGPNQKILLAREKDSILEEIPEFLDRMQQLKKTNYAPAAKARKEIFSEKGEAGIALLACLQGDPVQVRIFLGKYETGRDKEIDNLIDTCTKKYSQQYLVSKPRKQLREDIRHALDLCQKWLEVADCEKVDVSSHAENEFHRIFSSLPDDFNLLRQTEEGSLLADHLENLRACPARKLPEALPALNIDLWHLRVPDSNAQGILSPRNIIAAVRNGVCRDDAAVAASLIVHMAKGSMDSVERYLKANPALLNIIPDFSAFPFVFENYGSEELETCLKNARSIWKENFEALVQETKTGIMNSEFRGAISTPQLVDYNSRVDQIEARISSGFSHVSGVEELLALQKDLLEEEKLIKAQLLERMQELEQSADLTQAARSALKQAGEYLDIGMINLSWDILEDITDNLYTGKALGNYSPIEPEEDIADKFYNVFLPNLVRVSSLRDRKLEKIRVLLRRPRGSQQIKIDLEHEITSLLSRIGFNINQDKQNDKKLLLPGGQPNYWQKYIFTHMDIAGPLPQWGIAHKRHIIYAGIEVRPENIRALFDKEDFEKNTCTTIICCNTLSLADREKIIYFCAEKGVAPLVIDDNLLYFLDQHTPETLKSLFNICLAGADIIPYTDVAGAVPKEMFFGRERDIEQILDMNGPCIIYGGRQMGKSAILRQISNRIYPDVKVLLHSMNNNETSMLEEIRNECAKAGIIQGSVTIKSLSDNIEKWLNTHPNQRILMLLDECDRVLDRDKDNNFAEITELRSLMEKSGRRFKIVLTGLHSVQRFETIANQPFLHFGDALCVGPLPSRPASELITVPMGTLGMRFENPQLVQLILNHCGYQPKLIQVFCIELLKAFQDRKQRAPFRKIDSQTISEIYKSHNLREVIKKCFNMTLNMDERYLVIGYVLGVHKEDNMTLRELLVHLRYYWPAAFTEDSVEKAGDMLNTLESLLHEMMGLGLVSKLNDHYRLRTPNVIELLGGEESILEKLADYESRPYEPTGNPDKIRLEGADVLVASQYNLLSEKVNNYWWITGSSALGLERIPEILQSLQERQGINIYHLKENSAENMLRKVKQIYNDKGASGGIICWFYADEFPYTERFMEIAIPWILNLRASKKFIKIISLVDPFSAFLMYKNGSARKYSTHRIQLLPWSLEGVKEWCKEKNMPKADPTDIIQKSSGWYYLVQSCFKDEGLKDFSLDDILGKGKTVLSRVLQLIKSLGDSLPANGLDSTAGELFELFENDNPGKFGSSEEMKAALETLVIIGAIRETSDNLSIDPLVANIVN